MSLRPTPDVGVQLVKLFEGVSLTRYICAAGYPTIGFGHVCSKTQEPITDADAEALLRGDLERTEQAVLKTLQDVPLADNQYAAVVSLTFNIGTAAFRGSTLCHMLKKQDYDGAADQFPKWKFGGGRPLAGLVRRRAAERALFLNVQEAA